MEQPVPPTPTARLFGGAGEASDSGLLHECVDWAIARRPSAAAITCGGATISYGQLDRSADALATELAGVGVARGGVVAIRLPGSIEYTIAVLGVLRAGAAFLPLDTTAPEARQLELLDRAGVELVVGDPVPGITHVAAAVTAGGDQFERPEISESDLAYVVPTSGTTGTPLLPAVSHRAASRHTRVMAAALDMRPGESTLGFSAPCFDLAQEELWVALATGGRLVLRGQRLWSADEFIATLAAERIAVAQISTAYWAAIAGELSARTPAPRALRCVVIGTELARATSLERWAASPLASVPLVNAYGGTEQVNTSIAGVVDLAAPTNEVPVGRPLPTRRVRLVADSGDPLGAVGELHVGGPILSEGYLGDDDETAARFYDDDGIRWFRTGDRFRERAGVFTCVGRLDGLLNVRGVRVDAGEVESVLTTVDAVTDAVVMVDERSSDRLVAVLAIGGADAEETTLLARDHLDRRLPSAARPDQLLAVDRLPVTGNGKVDRRAVASRISATPD